MEFTGEFADARKRLYELAVEQKLMARAADDDGEHELASNHRLISKSLAIASKALDGDIPTYPHRDGHSVRPNEAPTAGAMTL